MTPCHRSVLAFILVAAALAAPARADVNLCLNCCGNTSLIYQCYETELTCDEIEIGPIIRECEQLSGVAPSGGFGPGVVGGVHPDVDGQSVLGNAVFDATAVEPWGVMSDFIVLWESRDTLDPGRRAQAVGRTETGALYIAEFDVNGIDRRSVGDLVITGTPAGEEVLGAFDLAPTGRIAGGTTGDMTITVSVVSANTPPGAKASILEVHHTDINFEDLSWSFLSSEPVTTEPANWSALKASYEGP